MSTIPATVGQRIEQAMELHPRAPEVKYGRLTWLQRELAARGVSVTVETVRKWIAGEVVPRSKKMSVISEALGVDEAWLTVGAQGRPSAASAKTALQAARGASGAVLTVASALEMEGYQIALLGEEEEADILAVIAGEAVRITVLRGTVSEEAVEFEVPGKRPDHSILGVAPGEQFGSAVIVDLRGVEFAPRGGVLVASVPKRALSRLKITSIEQVA